MPAIPPPPPSSVVVNLLEEPQEAEIAASSVEEFLRPVSEANVGSRFSAPASSSSRPAEDMHILGRLLTFLPRPQKSSLPALPDIELTTRTWWLFFAFGCIAILGALYRSPVTAGIGLLGWAVILLRWLDIRFRLTYALEQDPPSLLWLPSEASYRSKASSCLRIELRGLSDTLWLTKASLRHSVHLRSQEATLPPPYLVLHPQTPIKLSFPLFFPIQGRFPFYGLEIHLCDPWELFRTKRYLPAPTFLRVMPSLPNSRLLRQGKPRYALQISPQGIPQRRIGTGSDLHDIREYQPGDSRRSIVWKHSLRHQKLLARDFESETPIATYLLLDISQSMREGPVGMRKLDHCIEIATAFSQRALESNDRVGLITFDGEIYQNDLPDRGRTHFQRLLLHLEGLHQITSPRFCALSLGEIFHLVTVHLYREGYLAEPKGRKPATARPLLELLWDVIQTHPSMRFPKEWESEEELISLVLRTFSQGAGIELPYRFHQWVTYKAAGLSQAIDAATSKLQGGQLLIVLSDMADILQWESVLKSLRRARSHRHHAIFLSPFSPWFASAPPVEIATLRPPPSSFASNARLPLWSRFLQRLRRLAWPAPRPAASLEQAQAIAHEIMTIEQWSWRRRTQALLSPLGIPVLSVDPQDAPLLLMERLRRLRSQGRM